MEGEFFVLRAIDCLIMADPSYTCSTRKQIKIRPGFTPQEDIRRFRGTKQAQMDANSLPKGHIIGWTPSPTSPAVPSSGTKPLSKSAKKNAKRKERREEKKVDNIRDDWEEEDKDEEGVGEGGNSSGNGEGVSSGGVKIATGKVEHAPDRPNWAIAPESKSTMKAEITSTTTESDADTAASTTASGNAADGLASKLEKLDVQ
jgi:partner of Y14 and mago protein